MKKIKKAITTISIILAIFAICGFAETHYSMKAKVIATKNNSTIFEDVTGNLWETYDTDYFEGQEVRLFFYDNGTVDDRTDDIIDKVDIR